MTPENPPVADPKPGARRYGVGRAESPADLLAAVRAAPDDALALSRIDCHAHGLDSIVLARRPDGSLLRFFMAWPDHTLWMNGAASERFSVGIHSHRYSLRLRPVVGLAMNVRWRHTLRPFGRALHRFAFRSIINQGGGAEPRGRSRLTWEGTERFDQSGEEMGPEDLHTVYVPRGECAAWVVDEGPVERDETDLYTTEPTVEIPSTFYREFANRTHVETRVSAWVHGLPAPTDPEGGARHG